MIAHTLDFELTGSWWLTPSLEHPIKHHPIALSHAHGNLRQETLPNATLPKPPKGHVVSSNRSSLKAPFCRRKFSLFCGFLMVGFKGSEALGTEMLVIFPITIKEISFLRKEGSDDYLGIAVVQHQPFTDGFMVSVSGGSTNPEKWVPVFLLRSSAVKMSHEQIHSASNKFDTNFKHIYRTQTARVLFLFLIKHVVTCTRYMVLRLLGFLVLCDSHGFSWLLLGERFGTVNHQTIFGWDLHFLSWQVITWHEK